MSEAILRTEGLGKRFGGLEAVKDVSLEVRRGQLHAILGPNGAGKSTLINLLSGDLSATSGAIRHRGKDVTRLPSDARSRVGIGRSYQKTSIFTQLTAYENARLAAQSRLPSAFRVLQNAYAMLSLRKEAERALEAAGLPAHDRRRAGTLSHGEQRQLEIAMVLATRPEVLLLDEPLAGMGSEEAARIVALLKTLAPDHAILLVEHDMDAVFAVADVITVMVEGQVLESGLPAAIRASPAVRQAYLADDEPPLQPRSAGQGKCGDEPPLQPRSAGQGKCGDEPPLQPRSAGQGKCGDEPPLQPRSAGQGKCGDEPALEEPAAAEASG